MALSVAAATAVFATVRLLRASLVPSDLDQLWYAAKALLHGADPYQAVGPGRAFDWPWPLFYPLPAVLLAVPFTVFPIAIARFLFAVLSAGALGFAMGARWRVMWPLFLSMSYLLAISRNQWSPLLLAAAWLPQLGFVVAAKPNVGLMAVSAQTPRNVIRMLVLAGALAALSFLVRPSWFAEWYAIVRSLPNQKIALLQPAGFLLLAAFLAWRRAEGRVLLAASLVPQTPALYDALPLFAICRTTREALIVAALTHLLQWTLTAFGPFATFDAAYVRYAQLNVVLLLLPLLLMVLLPLSPRRGTLPDATRGQPREPKPSALDLTLTAAITVSLGIHLWLLFHP